MDISHFLHVIFKTLISPSFGRLLNPCRSGDKGPLSGNDLNSARIIDDVSPDGEAEAEAEAQAKAEGPK